MDDPQDIQTIVNDGLKNNAPVHVKTLASAIRQKFGAPAELTDGAVIKQFAAANPDLGMERLSYLQDDTPSQSAPSGTVNSPWSKSAPADQGSSDWWNALRRGAIKGVASMGDFAANATELAHNIDPGKYIQRAINPESIKYEGAIPNAIRGFAQWERGRAATMPPPSGMLATAAEALPEAVGQVAPYALLPEAALPVGAGAGTAAKIAARAIPAAVKMGAVEAVRAADQGPAAMLKAGTEGAAVGGVGFPAAESTIGKFPLIRALPDAARRFVSVAIPAGAMSAGPGASIEQRIAKGIPYGLMAAVGSERKPAERAETPKLSSPATNSPPSAVPAEATTPVPVEPVQVKLTPRAKQAMDLFLAESARNPKFKATPTVIAQDLGLTNKSGMDKIAGAKIYSELRLAGRIAADGSIIAAPATAPPPSALAVTPASVAAAPSPQSAPVEAASAKITPEQRAAAESAFAAPESASPPQPASATSRTERINQRIAELEQILASRQAPTAAPPTQAPIEATMAAPVAPTVEAIPAEARPATAPATEQTKETATPQPTAPTAEAAPTPQAAAPTRTIDQDKALLKAYIARFAKGETGTQYYDWRRPQAEQEILPSEVMQALKNVGADFLSRTGRNFEEWRNAMVGDIGAWVEAHLMPVWQQIQGQVGSAKPQEQAPPTAPPPVPTIQLKEGGPHIPVTPNLLDRFRVPSEPPHTSPREPSVGWEKFIKDRLAQGKTNNEIMNEALAQSKAQWYKANAATAPPPSARAPLALQAVQPTPGPVEIQVQPSRPTSAAPVQAPTSAVPPTTNPPAGYGDQLAQAMTSAGLVVGPEEVPNALQSAGFSERQAVFTSSGQSIRLNPKVLRSLPSGQQASEVWNKPVQDGSIEVQRNDVTGEWSATKHYADGTDNTVSGTSNGALVEYLNNVQAHEVPMRPSQQASQLQSAAVSSVRPAPATAPPPSDVIAEAAQRIRAATGKVATAEELANVLQNLNARGQAQQTETREQRIAAIQRELDARKAGAPPADVLPGPPPERLAQAMTMIDMPRMQQIIADTVKGFGSRQPPTAPPPTFEQTAPGVEQTLTEQSAQPTGKKTRVEGATPFQITKMSDNAWLIQDEYGVDTNIHISKDSPTSKFYNVYVGPTFKRKFGNFTAAKIGAIKIAEQYSQAGVGTQPPAQQVQQ